MCEELKEELERGSKLALALVDHLRDMGGAGACTIPVLDRAEEYVVCVMPKRMHEDKGKHEARLKWLHAAGPNDSDGCEWGIYRVKWVNGKAVELWQTLSDFSDLDAEMAKSQNDPKLSHRRLVT